MTEHEVYWLLFTDVLVSNFAISTNSEIVLDTLQIFGGHDQKVIFLVTLSAYMCSVCVNHLFGRVCYKILAPMNESRVEFDRKILVVNKFLPLILMISPLPFFGKFIILLSGFCRAKFKIVFIIALLAKCCYYLYSYANIPLF